MPDKINLRAYLAQLDDLLRSNASDEVIHHSRHILQYFPKNAEAYRMLGVALLRNGRWDEASAVFRRILSAYPDDFTAHIGLSEVYEHKGRPSDAIWHLERAFEQEPNNQEIIDHLRTLYRTHQNNNQVKIQLTAAAVARQHMRNGMYDQALETLHSSLERMPDRIDLRLMLAETLWNSGQQVEAAETALDVLRTLPDAVDANRILTELWLSEGRPSDAQRYLSRIESIDPYLAVELAQNQPAPDDAFTLDELDYRRAAQSELTSSRPDWLEALGDTKIDPSTTSEQRAVEGDMPNWLSRNLTPTPAATPSAPGTALPDDWFADVDNIPGSMTEEVAKESKRDTSTLANIFESKPSEENREEYPEWLLEAAPDIKPQEEEADDDPMAWLRASGVEIEDAPASEPLFNNEDFSFEHKDHDPLAWTQAAGIELQDVPAPSLYDLFGEEQEMQITDPISDPLDWMKDYDNLLSGEQASPTPAPAQSTTSEEDDSFDWLQDETLLDDINPASGTGGTFAQASVTAEREGDMPDNDKNLPNWLDSDDNDVPDWLGDLKQPAPSAQPTEPEAAGLDWMANLEDDNAPAQPAGDMPSWLTELEPGQNANQAAAPQTNEDDGFEWMSGFDTEEDEQPAAPVADTPDWLTSAAPATSSQQPAQQDDSFSWMSGFDTEEEEPSAPVSDTPDWLTAAAPAGQTQQPAQQDDSFEWMSGFDTEEEEPAAPIAADTPDWLTAAAPVAQSQPVQQPEEDDSFEWMSGFDTEEEEPAAPIAADTPDWLTAAAPVAQSQPAQQPEEDEGFEWMSGFDTEEEDTEPAEPAAISDTPDWLTAAAPVAQSQPAQQPEEDEGFEWMSGFDTEEDEQPAAVSDTPDWLTAAAPVAQSQPTQQPEEDDAGFGWMSDLDEEEAAAPAVESGSFEWMSGFDTEEEDAEPAAPIAADTPDWLTAAAPAAVPAASQQPEEGDDEFGWMSDFETEEEGVETLHMRPAEPIVSQATVTEDEDEGFGWMSEFEDEEEAAVAPAEDADWLAEAAPTPAAAGAGEKDDDDGFGWMSEFEDEEEAAQPAASVSQGEPEGETFSWMSALEDEEEEPAPVTAAPAQPAAIVEEDEFGWEEEEEPLQPVQDTPDWLSGIMESKQPEAVEDEAEPAAVEEFEWMQDISADNKPSGWPEDEFDVRLQETDVEEDDLATHAPARNAPDWLNAMVPGVDLDYETDEEAAPVEAEAPAPPTSEFNWLVDIVEEETGMMRAVEMEEEVEETAVATPRFVFTKPPAWLRGAAESALTSDAALPEWERHDNPADENDLDLPDWLK